MVMHLQCMLREQRVVTEELREVLSMAVQGEQLSAAQNHQTDSVSLIHLELEQSHEVSRGPEVRLPQAQHLGAPREVDQHSE